MEIEVADMSELGTQAGGPSSTVRRAESQIAPTSARKASGRARDTQRMSPENVSLVERLGVRLGPGQPLSPPLPRQG
jgi:hypothetical protein